MVQPFHCGTRLVEHRQGRQVVLTWKPQHRLPPCLRTERQRRHACLIAIAVEHVRQYGFVLSLCQASGVGDGHTARSDIEQVPQRPFHPARPKSLSNQRRARLIAHQVHAMTIGALRQINGAAFGGLHQTE